MIKLFLIGLFMFGAMLAIGNFNHTNAQEPELIMEGEVEEEEATEAAMLIVVEYQLPYPGILPDHPIYKLKMLRDRILELLTTDQIKKADFYLLQADKRLAASILLLEKENDSLSETTSSKGLDYLEKTINQINEAKESQLGTDDIVLKINSSPLIAVTTCTILAPALIFSRAVSASFTPPTPIISIFPPVSL